MSALYEVTAAQDGTSYKFQTSSGNIYNAYFTEFILLDEHEKEIPVVSFGFTCKNEQNLKKYDPKIKHTIIHILQEFFNKQPDNAVLYICFNADGQERSRHITFGRWFNDAGAEFEKHNAPKAVGKQGFYCSIIVKTANPDKQTIVDAFYFTLGYWGLMDDGG